MHGNFVFAIHELPTKKMNDYESIYNFRYRIDYRICIVLCDHNNNGSKREIQERRRT